MMVQDECIMATMDDEPRSYQDALNRPDKDKWIEAINLEVASLQSKGTWVEVDTKQAIKKPITAKWVFKIKRKADGSIERYKARLVARGFTQKYGIDFLDTFAPVARMASIRLLLAVACIMDYNLTQMDVDTAFLNGDLDEEL